ncbi:MAG: glycosyltransferase family 39 protein [Lachnospiraceae bacterium]|nr:glycosyltransferase family 39 protein [Lachnospiraceae bacterium]
MIKRMNTVLIKRLLFWSIFIILVVWTGVLCFYHLGEAGIQNWDEARHIVNAYEMMSSDNLWINTYFYETDYYNFKPPLSMWLIMLSFRIFGINSYSMRLFSAVSMFLLFIVLVLFTASVFGKRAATITGVVFISVTDVFFFHMARSADADAIYILLFTISILCLYKSEKKPFYIIGFGLFLSLAFMAKSFHAAIGFVIFICYLPRIYKNLNLKHYISMIIAGSIPVGIWAVIRYSYDGLAFFRGMFLGEVVDRVENSRYYFMYLINFGKKPIIMLSVIAVIIGILVIILNKGTGEKVTINRFVKNIIYNDLYLIVLWLFIPLAAYSASGAFMEWYCYICYFPFYIIVGAVLGQVSVLGGKTRIVAAILLILPLIGCVLGTKQSIWKLNTLSYENNIDIRKDIASLIESYPEYSGKYCYIENSRNEYQPQNVWEQNNVAEAYIQGDLIPVNGGVQLFLEDKEAILIISKNIFENYYDLLAGRIILVDGSDYLIFNNYFY